MNRRMARHPALLRNGIAWREEALERGVEDPGARARMMHDLSLLRQLAAEVAA